MLDSKSTHNKELNTVKNTVKSTGLLGGSQVISIFFSIFKNKILALLLGPAGIGLIQLFIATIDLLKSIFGLGLEVSSVREISEKIGSSNQVSIAKTVVTLKRWVWFSGLIGIAVTVVFSKDLSILAFGMDKYWREISVLSTTIVITNLGVAYSSIIKSSGNILDYAKVSVISSFLVTVISIIIYFYLEERGIIPVLVLSAIIIFAINYFYSKRVLISKVNITIKDSFFDGLAMVKLGLYTVFTSFISQGVLFYVRSSIGENLGIDNVGYYSVAITLTVTYMGIIFTSMATEYFPRLSKVNNDDVAVNNAVLEQTKIVLLLGVPLIISMFTFSDLIVVIMYSKEFINAIPILLWMLLSVFIRLIGFPIGYVFLAKNKGKIFIFTQSFWNIIFVTLVLLSWQYVKTLEAIGVAFAIAYILGLVLNILIIRKLTKFRYDLETIKYMLMFSVIVILYFTISHLFDGYMFTIIKAVGLIFVMIYNYKKIEKLIDIDILQFIKLKIRGNKN